MISLHAQQLTEETDEIEIRRGLAEFVEEMVKLAGRTETSEIAVNCGIDLPQIRQLEDEGKATLKATSPDLLHIVKTFVNLRTPPIEDYTAQYLTRVSY